MAETIEQFVHRIQTEGVEAGQQQADQIIADANARAEQIVADADARAESIVADAEAQARSVRERSETELRLAARDTVLRLREALGMAIEQVLRQAVGEKLDDVDFLGNLLHEIVMLHARDDEHGGHLMTVNVPVEKREKLVDWAIQEIGQAKVEGLRPRLDLHATLSQAGFEYTTSDATVEVTVNAVVDALKDLVTPRLRELLDQAVAEAQGDDASQAAKE